VSSSLPLNVDVFVCEGRVCASNGAAAVVAGLINELASRGAGSAHETSHARVRRGGCYGLCDLGPNVVVRRKGKADGGSRTPDDDADRLSLRGGADEDVCIAVAPADLPALVDGVAAGGRPPAHLLRAAREATVPPRSPIAARLRTLRAQRGTTRGAVNDDDKGAGGQGNP
jgi:(2Fe-2S) ferredoxin